MTTITQDETRIQRTLSLVEQLETAEDELDTRPEVARERLRDAITNLLDALPITVAIAAKLLNMSPPTVRAWLREGVLLEAPEESKTRSVIQLEPHRFHEVLHLVRELRDKGANRGDLMERVWWRLSDQAVLDRADLQESLAQMRRGETVKQ